MTLFSMLVGSMFRSIVKDSAEHTKKVVVHNYPSGWLIFWPTLSVFVIALFVTTSAVFHDDDYRNLLNVTQVEEFHPDDVLLDQTQARFVDQDLSSRSASELLGTEMGLGSRYNIGTMRIQSIQGKVTAPRPKGRGFQLLRPQPVRDRIYAGLHWQGRTILPPST
jgi:hypothetical protein